ncbi:MAG: hypothetical protein H7308_13495 [Chthonomonadaceae bacterium]|nr:hypothetical protein [Chthonomonadaceae bacterium]
MSLTLYLPCQCFAPGRTPSPKVLSARINQTVEIYKPLTTKSLAFVKIQLYNKLTPMTNGRDKRRPNI